MGHGFKSGAGSAGINLKLLAYSTESALLAASASDNVIGIVTNQSISEYIFSAAEPDSLPDGGIWIKTGVTGNVSVNVLRKNAIQLELISCKQMASGKLTSRLAYLRKNGGWVKFATTWDGYYFKAGEQYTEITGGWIEWSETTDGSTPTIKSTLTAQSPYYGGTCTIGTSKAVDLTEVSSIKIYSVGTITGAAGTAYAGSFIVSKSKSSASPAKSVIVSSTGEFSIDVSGLSGSYYLGLTAKGGSNGAGYISLNKIWKV